MAVFNMIEEADATGKVKEVFEDIKKKRNTKDFNYFDICSKPGNIDKFFKMNY